MKIIAFIEHHQSEVIEKILPHCSLWDPPGTRGPPSHGGMGVPPVAPPPPGAAFRLSKTGVARDEIGGLFDADSSVTLEPDGDYLDFRRQEQ